MPGEVIPGHKLERLPPPADLPKEPVKMAPLKQPSGIGE